MRSIDSLLTDDLPTRLEINNDELENNIIDIIEFTCNNMPHTIMTMFPSKEGWSNIHFSLIEENHKFGEWI